MKTSIINWVKRNAYWLKWTFSLGLLALIVIRVDTQSLMQSFSVITWWYYPVSIFIFLIVQVIATIKWRLYLPSHSFGELYRLNIMAVFYAFALPSTITGDIAKVLKTNKKQESTAHVMAGVLVDRIVGLVALFLLILLSLALTKFSAFKPMLLPVAIVFIFILLALSLIYTPFYGWLLGKLLGNAWIQKRSFYIPLSKLHGLYSSISGFFFHFRLMAKSLALSLLFQLCVGAAYLIINHLMQLQLSITEFILVSALTQVLMFLPLSIGGVGIKDVSFIGIMGLAGISSYKALSVSLIGYPITLLFVLIGFILHLNLKK